MPTETTINYAFGGPATLDIYSEQEQAEAIGMTVADLRATLDEDMYGPIPEPDRLIYSYHGHPLANGGREHGTFLFNRQCYQDKPGAQQRAHLAYADRHLDKRNRLRM